jgi:hypothetical protein
MAYSAMSVLPLEVGALTRTPRLLSSFSIASTWKESRVSPAWALKAATRRSMRGGVGALT